MVRLEAKTAESGFWDDNQSAQLILKEISRHKKRIDTVGRLEGELSDSEELSALVEEGSPEAEEIRASLDQIAGELDRLELATLLSGPDDHRDAILTIHPGAGGTESQDWADMLFRMYNRWAERRQFGAQLMDYQP